MTLINARCLGSHTTGVQRYTSKICGEWKTVGKNFNSVRPETPMHGFTGHAWEQFYLPSQCHNSEVLWSPSNTGPLAVANQVVTLHDIVPFDHPEWLNPKFVAWYKFLQPRLVKRIKHIITISEFSKERIVKVLKVAPEKISVIYNGVDRLADSDLLGSDQLQIPYRRYVLAVGSLEPRKNIQRLLDAWQLALPRIAEDIGLVVVGAKGLNRVFSGTGIDQEKTSTPRVYFTGHVDDVMLGSLYKNALLFCYPSLYEGFGLPPLEAMAYGTPVITSATTAMLEICQGYATLIDPLSVNDMANALVDNARAPDHNLAKMATVRAAELSWQRCARETWDVIQSC